MLTDIRIEGFRSVRAFRRLAPVCVVVGANGTGKTNLYQALRLQAAASGASRAVADAGGIPSILCRRTQEGRSRLRVA
jgi:predicted ATPase